MRKLSNHPFLAGALVLLSVIAIHVCLSQTAGAMIVDPPTHVSQTCHNGDCIVGVSADRGSLATQVFSGILTPPDSLASSIAPQFFGIDTDAVGYTPGIPSHGVSSPIYLNNLNLLC
ncbi:MAG: hypothetical protein A4E57_04481 [Syntrophorhabdaceae bacterium PtaU1.Bin034]|jgi:hypothetical protein|nr:MAG: hypothetical protein A4E57_04481 [Syntrophorhabdaceae bacterium PtaU1.Bin034]